MPQSNQVLEDVVHLHAMITKRRSNVDQRNFTQLKAGLWLRPLKIAMLYASLRTQEQF